MPNLTRRTFLKAGASLAALMGLGASAVEAMADAVEAMVAGTAPVLWLQGQSCSGCSISLLNTEQPGPLELLTGMISLKFHQTLSAATGTQAVDIIDTWTKRKGEFILVVEGSIPAGMPEACLMDGKPVADQVAAAARNAKLVVAVGTCASYGGIPSAKGNQTGAVSVPDFLDKQKIDTKVIRVPGCPAHPDWVVGTLAHVLKFGMPELLEDGRPVAFYGKVMHDNCPRRGQYERDRFAKRFGDDGCLYKLGCSGPTTRADCAWRLWNGGTSSCIHSGAPCIGCTWSSFAADPAVPLYGVAGLQVERNAPPPPPLPLRRIM